MSNSEDQIKSLEDRVQALEAQVESLADAIAEKSSSSSSPPPHPTPAKDDDAPSDDAAGDDEDFTVIQVDGKPLGPSPDSDTDQVRYAWKIVAKNNLPKACFVDAHVQFVDMDSFVIAEHSISNFPLAAGLRQKISGQHELSPEDSERVMGVKGWLNRAAK